MKKAVFLKIVSNEFIQIGWKISIDDFKNSQEAGRQRIQKSNIQKHQENEQIISMYTNERKNHWKRVYKKTKDSESWKHYRQAPVKRTNQRTHQHLSIKCPKFFKTKNLTNQNAPKCWENGVAGTGETQHLAVTNNFAHRGVL